MADTSINEAFGGIRKHVQESFTRPENGGQLLTAVGIGAAGLEGLVSLWEQFQAGEMTPISFVFAVLTTGVGTVFNAVIYGVIGYGIGWVLDNYSGVNIADEARDLVGKAKAEGEKAVDGAVKTAENALKEAQEAASAAITKFKEDNPELAGAIDEMARGIGEAASALKAGTITTLDGIDAAIDLNGDGAYSNEELKAAANQVLKDLGITLSDEAQNSLPAFKEELKRGLAI